MFNLQITNFVQYFALHLNGKVLYENRIYKYYPFIIYYFLL